MDLDSRGDQSQRQLTTLNLKICGKKADNHDGRRDDAESNLWDDGREPKGDPATRGDSEEGLAMVAGKG
jgi:hypothetical protein